MLATFRFKLFLSEAKDFRIWLLYTRVFGKEEEVTKKMELSYGLFKKTKQNKNQILKPKDNVDI